MKEQFSAAVAKWDLSKSPFYQAWTMGTLSVHDLRRYASEYGAFISLLPRGWKTLNDSDTEHEEEEHYDLWRNFAKSIDAEISAPALAATKELVATAEELFAKPATAIGAMYAFEVQQPLTAQSKLKGLQSKYTQLAADETYFEEHSHNEHESEKLLKLSEALAAEDQNIARAACEKMSKALWDTLADIYSRKS